MKKTPRARSLRQKRPFYKALFWAILFYLGIICTLTSFIAICVAHSPISKAFLIGSICGTGFFWIASLLARKSATCALCRSTPYHDTGAVPHQRSTKIPVLNYGHSNMVRSLCTCQFRCQHCGELYDLSKPSSL